MRLCGSFAQVCKLAHAEQRSQGDTDAGQSLAPALLAIDHADRVPDREAGLPQRLHRSHCGPAGRDDVLDETRQISLVEGSLELVARPVALGTLRTITNGSPEASEAAAASV